MDKVTSREKSTWQKEVKETLKKEVKRRMFEEMTWRTKCRTIENDRWGRKEYIKEGNSGTVKDLFKIRLYIWDLKASYGKKGLDNRFPMSQSEEGTTEHVLECKKGNKKFSLNDERGKEWGKDNRRTRKTDQ